MQFPIWVLPGPFPHRGNAHPVGCATNMIFWGADKVLAVVIKLKRCPYVRAAWAREKVHPGNGFVAQIGPQGFTTKIHCYSCSAPSATMMDSQYESHQPICATKLIGPLNTAEINAVEQAQACRWCPASKLIPKAAF
jgi:hypothetical protein